MSPHTKDPFGIAIYGAQLTNARLYKADKRLEAQLLLDRLIDAGEAQAIQGALGAQVPGCAVTLSAAMADGRAPQGDEAAFQRMLEESWCFFSPLMKPVFHGARWEFDSPCSARVFIPEKLYKTAKSYNGACALTEFVQGLYGVGVSVVLVGDATLAPAVPERRPVAEAPSVSCDPEDLPPWETLPETLQDAKSLGAAGPKTNAQLTKTPGGKTPAKRTAPAKKTKIPQADIIYGNPVSTKPAPMSEVNEESGTVTVRGEILSIDTRPRKNGGFILQFYLTDKSNTLPVKMFPREEEKKLIARVEEVKAAGDWLVIHGRYQRDEFSGLYCVFADSIYRVDAQRRADTAERKRVELHLHTKMSAMDGFIDAAEAVKTAAKWGHKAVAITDHGVAQAFPFATSAADKLGKKGKEIKVIMGVEGYLLPDCQLIPDTGAFCALWPVTEKGALSGSLFGLAALKVNEAGEQSRFFTPVNPGVPMTKGVEEASGLTPEQIASAPTTGEALRMFADFLAGETLVLHTAEALHELYKKARSLNIKFPRKLIVGDRLAHYLCRGPEDDTSTPEGCLVAMGITPASCGPMEQAEALWAMFEGIRAQYAKRGVKRLPLFDCVPKERVKGQRATYHIILIAKNHTGLKNLYQLVSYAHMDHLKGVPRIPRSLLQLHREGIILGSACEAGELFCAVLENKPHEEICAIAREYDYLEVQPIGNNAFLVREELVKDEEGLRDLNRRIVALGEELSIPVVATGDAHFMDPEDAIFRAIVMSAREFKDAEQQAPLYFRTTDDMLEEFAYLGEEKAMEVVVDNPNAIADSCDKLKPFLSEKSTYAPVFPGANEELRGMCEEKAHEIYGNPLPPVVEARLERELKSIIGNDYASLYLSAQRLVSKSLSDGYLVGSRGSVGSSFVATMAGITEVNPLQPHYVCPDCRHSEFDVNLDQYSCGVDMPDKCCPACGANYQKLGYTIPFEVFLGFKGDKTPDIDLNFSGEYQPKAHAYTEVMYGKGHAFRAGTISGLKDKTVYGYIKAYTEQHNAFFTRAETERLVAGCAGVKRTTGQHPGGIVIVPDGYDIFDFTPIQFPADKSEKNTITTHFDFHAMDDRLVKLDILGHDDPTALRMLKDITGVDPQALPLDDPETMRIFSSIEPLGITLEELGCDVGSIAIPEFGTGFVRQMLMDTRPTTMEELVRIAGLSHGTGVWLDNAQELVLSKVATLSQVICTRDDIMNYLIARGGDPSMSFKIMESVRKGRGLTEEMEAAMKQIDTPKWFVESCKKIGYMFPRAHAAAYVMMAFRIAWYKVHQPLAFYAVYFTARADAFDVSQAMGGEERVLKNIKAIRDKGNKAEQKEQDLLVILEVVYEMNRRGIALLPVDLYKSDATHFLAEGNALRPPFSAVAGVGASAAEGIGAAKRGSPFASVEDFRSRTKANSGVVEKLRALGCFDGVPESNQLSLF